MAITTVQLYVAFSKLFKTVEPSKEQVMQFGVTEADFDSVDQDKNEYLDIDEALQSTSISELLYSDMVSAYGSGEAEQAQKNLSKKQDRTAMVEGIDPTVSTGNNPFI